MTEPRTEDPTGGTAAAYFLVTPGSTEPAEPLLVTNVTARVSPAMAMHVAVFPRLTTLVLGREGLGAGLNLQAADPGELLVWLDRARDVLCESVPGLAEAATPDPMLIEARAIVREDILGPLGVDPSTGEVREIPEVGQVDVRRARRMGERVVDILGRLIDGEAA